MSLHEARAAATVATMTTVALLLALAAAVMHAAWNLILKGSEDRLATITVMGIVGTVAYLPWILGVEGLIVLGIVALGAV